ASLASASSVATQLPLPLVPPTVTMRYGGARNPIAPSTARTRSRPRSISRGCSRSCQASQAARSLSAKRRSARLLQRPAGEHGQQARDGVAHLAPVHDHVEGAVLEEELAALEAFRQGLAHGLLDDARAGKANQRLGLGDVDVAEHSQAGGHAAGGRV